MKYTACYQWLVVWDSTLWSYKSYDLIKYRCVSINGLNYKVEKKQGKSEGFDSCDRPSNLTQIGFKLSISAFVTLKYDGWPKKTIGHLFYATLSFLQHVVAIGEFKLKLESEKA